MTRFLYLLAFGLLFLPTQSRADVSLGVGTTQFYFLDDDGAIEDIKALSATASYEIALNTDAGKDYLGLGLPVAADEDELIWGYFAEYRRRISKYQGSFGVGLQLSFVPESLAGESYKGGSDTAIFAGPRASLLYRLPLGGSGKEGSYLPVEIAGYLGWEFAGPYEEPKVAGFSISLPNDLME